MSRLDPAQDESFLIRDLKRRNRISPQLLVAPSAEPVSLDQVKTYLKVDYTDEDAMIAGLISRARRAVEEYTRRALLTQTWQQLMDYGPFMTEIARPPLQSVTKIEVTGFDGTVTQVDPSVYVVDTVSTPGRIILNPGQVWPVWPTMRGFASFKITYVAGYGNLALTVPEPFIQVIYELVAFWYLNREGQNVPNDIFQDLDTFRLRGPLQQSYRPWPAVYQAWF